MTKKTPTKPETTPKSKSETKRQAVLRCKACADPDNVIRHTCGLRDLQKLLRF